MAKELKGIHLRKVQNKKKDILESVRKNEERIHIKTEQEEVERERERRFVEKFAQENPLRYNQLLRKVKMEELSSIWHYNRLWLSENRRDLLLLYTGFLGFCILMIWLIDPVESSSLMNIIGYIVGVPGIVFSLLVLVFAEKEIHEHDDKPIHRRVAIILHVILLLLSVFVLIVLIVYKETFNSSGMQLFVIYTLCCIIVKCMYSIYVNFGFIQFVKNYIASKSLEDIDPNNFYNFIMQNEKIKE